MSESLDKRSKWNIITIIDNITILDIYVNKGGNHGR